MSESGSKEKRDQFIEDWESFVETCEDGLISPELIFSIHNMYLMAKAGYRDAKKYSGKLRTYFRRHNIDEFIQNNHYNN